MLEKEAETPVGLPASGDKPADAAPAGLGFAEELPLLRAAWDALPDALLLLRAATLQVVLANTAACQLLGYAIEELRGIELPRIAPESPNLLTPADRGVSDQGHDAPAVTPLSFRTRAGTAVPAECQIRAVTTPADTYLVLIARAADERGEGREVRDEGRGMRDETRASLIPHPSSLAPHPSSLIPDRDALTGLPDRRHFEGRLLVALRKARSRQDYHFAVLFVDLDGFKTVNDTWGHLHGDRVLHEIAAKLHACVRPEDTVARFGGDEFTVLVDHLRTPSDVVHVAERIQSQMQEPVEIEGRHATITASIGIALSWHGYHDAEAMLRDADRAMYRAKAEGKARYFIWAP